MVLKYLVPFLAISSVYGQRLGGDPKTWSPSRLTCDQCVSVVNRTETAMSIHACAGTTGNERIVCNDIVSLALDTFSPEVVCQKLGYCPNKVVRIKLLGTRHLGVF